MKDRHPKTEVQKAKDPRAKVVLRLIGIAEIIRKNGTPDEAAEAVEWEKKLQERAQQIEVAA